jgi:hypothetical protein
MRQSALEDFRHQVTVWAILAPYAKGDHRPPSPPPILREMTDDDA